MQKYLNRPPRDAMECQGDPDTEGGGIPEARGGIPRWEARYFAICPTLMPYIAIIPEFYTIFISDIQTPLGRKSNIPTDIGFPL